jgi:2'-5' RNA ligase
MATLTAAADGSHTSGAMIALMPTPGDAARLAIEGGEAADQLHLTLRYLGNGADFDDTARTAVVDSVRALAEGMPPITSKIFGAVHWNGNGAEPSWVWSVGDDPEHGQSLEAAHGMAEESLLMAPMDVEIPPPHTPWVAHICAAYSDELDLIIPMEERLGLVTFDRVRVAFAGDHIDIHLGAQVGTSPRGKSVAAAGRMAQQYRIGERVKVSGEPHEEGQDTGTIEEIGGIAYGIVFDGMEDMGIHHWYTATELAPEAGVTAAAGPLRRQPTELELASRADFAQMDKAWHEAVDSTVKAWATVQEKMRAEVTAGIKAAAEADDLDRLDGLTVDTEDGSRLLIARMISYAREAGDAQQTEAEAQGVTVPDWSLDDEALTAAAIRDRLRQVGRTAARVLGNGLVQSAVRQAMRVWGSGPPSQVAAAVDEYLAGLTGAAVEEQVGGAMSAAQNEGRMAVLAVAPPAEYTASEILDKNSCSPCRQIDGTRYTTLPDARAAYPSGGYIDCLGGNRCRGTLVTVWPQSQDQAAAGMILAASAATMRSEMNGGGGMPYEVVPDHPDCAADMPYAVVNSDTQEQMGCHKTQEEAQQHADSMNAEEEGEPQGSPGMPGMPGMDMAGETAPWEGVLAVEGIVTGDGREFAPGALAWADLPVPLRWNVEDSHGGEPHTVAVNVGRIDKIWRDGNKIMGSGVLDLSDDNGRRAYDKLKGEFLRGVSIDADSIADADVEFVWPEDVNAGTGDDEGDLFEMLFAQPEKMIFHGGRIRAATLVDIPAFAEAYIALLDEQGTIVAGGQPVGEAAVLALAAQELGAVGTHNTATSDSPWDAGVNEKRLPSPLTVDQARAAYAWYDGAAVQDGELPKTACKFLHHEISADGSAGPANLAACSASIGALHGGRGGTTIPDADRRGVYDHVAGHLRDAGQEPEPFRALHTVAASGGMWQPPAAWFSDPQLSLPTPITVTDDGRIYGHAAQWGSCHIGQEGVCVQPPHEEQHPYYRTGEVKCDDGSRVAVGQITVGTGHAPLHLGASPAAEHYDNTGSAVADVSVGNDAHGIWVAGAVRPGADPLKVYELQAAGQVSGDWRRIGGQLRLVGLLAVNVPGFPVPKMRARVASGEPQALVAAGRPVVAWGRSMGDQEREAVRLVMRMLSRRVHPGRG